ncbi:MAG: amino acid permease, partial [Leptospiraceae bacterium]|nr:amino acid permease [Leptospiraceae bacterium]
MELKKNLGFRDSFFLIFTSMVGSGIFFTTGFVLQSANHPLSVLICWALGAGFALLGALTYGSLAACYPHAGGDYVYLKKAYSEKLAFLSGWAS